MGLSPTQKEIALVPFTRGFDLTEPMGRSYRYSCGLGVILWVVRWLGVDGQLEIVYLGHDFEGVQNHTSDPCNAVDIIVLNEQIYILSATERYRYCLEVIRCSCKDLKCNILCTCLRSFTSCMLSRYTKWQPPIHVPDVDEMSTAGMTMCPETVFEWLLTISLRCLCRIVVA